MSQTIVEPLLDTPIVTENGTEIIPRGANFSGRVDTSKASGRLKGRAVMTLELDSFELNGRSYRIITSHAARVSGGHKKRNIIAIGGGAGAGAGIGALAGSRLGETQPESQEAPTPPAAVAAITGGGGTMLAASELPVAVVEGFE